MNLSNYLLILFFLLCCLPTLLIGQQTREITIRSTCIPKVGQENCTIKISVNGLRGSCADYDCDCNCDGKIVLDRQEMDISEVVQVRVGGVDPCADEGALCRMIERWQLGQLPHDPIIRTNPVRQPNPANRSLRNSKLPQVNPKLKHSKPTLVKDNPKAKAKSPIYLDKKKSRRRVVRPN